MPLRIHFSTFNHNPVGQATLVDMFLWLRAGLEDLGHTVTFSADSLDPAAINIVWECFLPPAVGANLAASNLTYGIIVTEFIDGVGFNKGTPQSNHADRRDAAYRERWEGFVAAAQGAKFFWSMVESNLNHLRLHAPASFVELGYSDRLVPVGTEEARIDFSFTGVITPHRIRTLEELSQYATVVWHRGLLPIDERDRLFLATRINLAPNKTVDWEMPSPTRVGKALLSKRGVSLDWTPQTTRQSCLVERRPKGMNFIDHSLALLNSNWRAAAQIAFERYSSELPMQLITERLLDECLLSRHCPDSGLLRGQGRFFAERATEDAELELLK